MQTSKPRKPFVHFRLAAAIVICSLAFGCDRPDDSASPETELKPAAAQVDKATAMQIQQTLGSGDLEKSREIAMEVLSKYPDDWEAHYAMGRWHTQQKEWPEAIKHFTRCSEIYPHPASWNNLGMMYLEMGELDKAMENAKKALSMDPDEPHIKDTVKQIEEAMRRRTSGS